MSAVQYFSERNIQIKIRCFFVSKVLVDLTLKRFQRYLLKGRYFTTTAEDFRLFSTGRSAYFKNFKMKCRLIQSTRKAKLRNGVQVSVVQQQIMNSHGILGVPL